MKLTKLKIIILLLFLIHTAGSASIVVKQSAPIRVPPYRFFKEGFEVSRPLKFKQITPAEYVTDPMILYGFLWGSFGTTYALWEDSPVFADSPGTFLNRFKMEPFATGRVDPFTKPVLDESGRQTYDELGNAKYTLRGDVYAKNLIEPFFFIQMGLYLRSKNYHPALLISEMFIMSMLYEFTVRSFFMSSSFEQLLKNPAVGLVFAILLDELSLFLLSTPFIGLHVLGYILNPFNALPVSRVHPMIFFDPYRQAATLETVIKF